MAEDIPPQILRAFGMQEAAVARIELGLVNRHWSIDLGHRRYVLRRYHPRRTLPAILWEQWLVDYAAKLGWPVATPVPAGDGETLVEHDRWYWAVAPHLEGTPGAASSPAAFRRIGETLAELHDNLSGLEGPQRPGFGPSWDLDTLVRQFGAASFDSLVDQLSSIRPELAELVRTQHARNLHELESSGVNELPLLPIHGDFQRFNLLWAGAHITGIVDWDYSRRDVLIADIAPILMPFMPLPAEMASELLRGYHEVRALSDRERRLLIPMVHAGLLRWVATLLAEWGGVGDVPDGVERTMTVRWPALEASAAAFEQLLAELHGT